MIKDEKNVSKVDTVITYFFENYYDEYTHAPAFRVIDESYLGLQYFIGNPSMSRVNMAVMVDKIQDGMAEPLYFPDTRVYFDGEGVSIHSFHPIYDTIYPVIELSRRKLAKVMRKMLYAMDIYYLGSNTV